MTSYIPQVYGTYPNATRINMKLINPIIITIVIIIIIIIIMPKFLAFL